MSKARPDLLGVYVDGETKTGKGAASQHISEVLQQKGLKVYYDVAGDFYRRYAALVRQDLKLSEDQVLLPGPELELAAQQIYKEKRVPYKLTDSFGDLQRPIIGESVSVFGKLDVAQQAGHEWWTVTVQNAWESGADVLVVDARNPRVRIGEVQLKNVRLRIILDLYMTCEAVEAAKRTLMGNGTPHPTPEQIQKEVINVINRRELDRNRPVNPFIEPLISESFAPSMSAADVIARSWQPHGEAELPVSIVLDNSLITKEEMLKSVSALATAALDFNLSTSKAA